MSPGAGKHVDEADLGGRVGAGVDQPEVEVEALAGRDPGHARVAGELLRRRRSAGGRSRSPSGSRSPVMLFIHPSVGSPDTHFSVRNALPASVRPARPMCSTARRRGRVVGRLPGARRTRFVQVRSGRSPDAAGPVLDHLAGGDARGEDGLDGTETSAPGTRSQPGNAQRSEVTRPAASVDRSEVHRGRLRGAGRQRVGDRVRHRRVGRVEVELRREAGRRSAGRDRRRFRCWSRTG